MSYPPSPPPPPPPWGPAPGPGGGGGYGGGYGGGGYGGGFPGSPSPAAAERAKAPAIVMMACTALGLALGLFGLVTNVLSVGAAAGTGDAGPFPMFSGGLGIGSGLVSLVVGAFALYGLNEMRNGRSWGLSLGAVIVSMVPCLGPCFCVNLFVGIWALVVLVDRDVKAGFAG